MRLKKLIKKINKENTPPGGWRPEDKAASSQAGGPAPKEPGFKHTTQKPQFCLECSTRKYNAKERS